MSDHLCRGVVREDGLVVAVALTTQTCRAAQRAHNLASTTSIALGRLTTATALAGFIQQRTGALSLQVVSGGRIKQLFADVTDRGDLRGYVHPADFALPRFEGDEPNGRRSVAAAIGTGKLSAIRTAEEDAFVQSATELVSGEIDLDVEHFYQASEQVPTALRCDVVLSCDDAPKNEIRVAGGIIVQALPGANAARIAELQRSLQVSGFVNRLTQAGSAAELMGTCVAGVEVTDEYLPLRWKCRCSHGRVLSALRSFDTVALAEMAATKEATTVSCDFCGQSYRVEAEEIARVFESTVTAQG